MFIVFKNSIKWIKNHNYNNYKNVKYNAGRSWYGAAQI